MLRFAARPHRVRSGSSRSPRKEETAINDINYLVERLERLLDESWRIPMSTYLVVNEEEMLDVIDQLRTAIPREIKQAERIHQERDRIVAQAQEERERILAMAREDAQKLAEDHEVIQTANQRAETIIERSHREAANLRAEADQYAREVLLALDGQLGSLGEQIDLVLSTVRNGLESLTRRDDGELDPEL